MHLRQYLLTSVWIAVAKLKGKYGDRTLTTNAKVLLFNSDRIDYGENGFLVSLHVLPGVVNYRCREHKAVTPKFYKQKLTKYLDSNISVTYKISSGSIHNR